MMKKIDFTPLVFGLILLLAAVANAEDLHLFRIGTGGQTGVYYPIGKIIAKGITDRDAGEKNAPSENNGIPNIIGVAQNSGGSIDNIHDIVIGDIEAGLVQADTAAWAFQGTHAFAGRKDVGCIRAIAALYPEKFQIVVRRDSGIHQFNDLREKRISVDEIGSGTLAVMRLLLDAHGLSETDLRPVYLKPIFTHEQMITGELDGFVMMAGAPMAAVNQLLSVGITLVPIALPTAKKIHFRYPYLVPARLASGTYVDVPEISTIQVYALLVVNQNMDATLAYQLAASLWSPSMRRMLDEGHSQGKAILPKTALTGISIPIHPGAKKYYQDHHERFNQPLQP